MRTWTFYWLTGQREVLVGANAADALNRAGYSAGALRALDFYSDGESDSYTWNAAERRWDREQERHDA
jgi:hypothetical protein